MPDTTQLLESATWSAAFSSASAAAVALLEADPLAWRRALERLLHETEDNLEAVRGLKGPEREQVVADLEDVLERLEAAYDLLTPTADAPASITPDPAACAQGDLAVNPYGEVRLQASWSGGQVGVWAAGAG